MAISLNYNHLRYFRAVAHEGNLTRTADMLNVSQSALSVQIRKLEDTLGHALFDRRGRQMILTEAGQIVLDHADAIFTVGAELVGTLDEKQGTAKQILRVGALSTLSRNFQIQFLKPLLGAENVEVIVRSGSLSELLQSLETHRLDVVLTNLQPQRDSATPWITHKIAEQPVGIVGSPKHVNGDKSLEELLRTEPIIVPTIETSIRSGFDALMTRMGIRPRIVAEVDDMAMLRLMARAEIGLAVVPPIVVKDELETGQLIQVETLPSLSEAFFALTLERRFPNPLLRRVI